MLCYDVYLQFVDMFSQKEGKDEFVLITRHNACITLGKNSVQNEVLEKNGVPIIESNRGGGATYHDLGQLVLYPFINIKKRGIDIAQYISILQNWGMQSLRDCKVERLCGGMQPGIWIAENDFFDGFARDGVARDGSANDGFSRDDFASDGFAKKKIAFIGLAVQKGWAMHGIAFNLAECDLSGFASIIPCKSFEKIGKCDVSFDQLSKKIIENNPFDVQCKFEI